MDQSHESQEGKVQPTVTCPFCTEKKRLLSFRNLKKGSHICFNGNKFKINIKKRQLALYTHHAIVVEVGVVSDSEAKLTLIHFTSTPFSKEIKIRKTIEVKNLLYDEIMVVHYKYPKDPDVVLERAHKYLAEKKVYDPFFENCEHLCNQCCADSKESLQVEDVLKLLNEVLSSLAETLSRQRPVVREVISNIREYFKCKYIVGTVAIQLIYHIYKHNQYKKLLKEKKMCSECYKKKKVDMFIHFVTLGTLIMLAIVDVNPKLSNKLVSLISLLFRISQMIKKDSDIETAETDESRPREMSDKNYRVRPIELGETLDDTVLLQIDHQLSRPLATMRLGKSLAKTSDEVKPGQVISLGRFRKKVICTDVTYSGSAAQLSVSYIHYGSDKKVCEETKDIDLEKEIIYIYVYHPLHRYSSRQVVERARKRIGQGGYNMFTHRSSHLAEEIVEKKIHTQVHDMRNVKPGDVIKICDRGEQYEAVVSEVQQPCSQKNVTVICSRSSMWFVRSTVVEEEFHLTNQTIYLNNYAGFYTYPKELVVERARSQVGKRRYAAEFVHWAKVIQEPFLVVEEADAKQQPAEIAIFPLVGKQYDIFQYAQVYYWGELKLGFIVSLKYYGMWHEGILSEFNESKNEIKVIHYGATHIFATREIMEETIPCDFKHTNLWVYRCDPSKSKNTKEILKSARARIGERNWELGNRSWHFCVKCVCK